MHDNRSLAAAPIEVGDLLHLIIRSKWIVGAFILVFGVAAAVFALLQPDVYRSEAQLKGIEAQNAILEGSQGLAALSSLAGLNLDVGGSDTVDVALAVLKSRDFLVSFVRRHHAVIPLIAGKGWDARHGRLIVDRDIYDPETNRWLRAAQPPLTAAPTDEEIYQKFSDILQVDRDAQTGLITISVTFVSPVLSQQWAELLIADLNANLRQKQIHRLDQMIVYLQSQLQATSITPMSQALEQLLLSQLRARMLAQGSEEFALQVIDPPNRRLTKSGPNRPLIVFAGALLGAIAGIIVAIGLASSRRPSE
jgi:uncharacterized protein involved in exopolysaccharide biosynthesis